MATLCDCGGTRSLNLSTQEYSCNKCDYKSKLQSKTLKEPETEIEKNMDRKEKFISKSLDKKNTAIEIAGAKRDACMIVTSMINQGWVFDLTEDGIKEQLEKWARYWINFDPSEEPEEEINKANLKF